MSDPCECFFDHEAAMQRLLSMLRGSQDYCTDSSCPTDGLPGTGSNSSLMMWTMLWTILAMGLYMLRPNSMRSDANRNQQSEGLLEKSTSTNNNNQPPPPPPPPAL